MKVGIFLSYVGLGSNLLHLSYCHEIAKKYGPVSVVTICKKTEAQVYLFGSAATGRELIWSLC